MSQGFIDLTGNSFANGLMSSVSANTNEKKAILFLFSPTQIHDHYKRSLTYQFNNELIEKAATLITSKTFGNSNNDLKSRFADECKTSILPSLHGIEMQYSKFSNTWTGVLIVFNDSKIEADMFQDMRNKINNRTIYLGLFDDEPINPLTLYTESPTLNLKAKFVITRKIMMNKINLFSPVHGLRQREDLMGDFGVFNYFPELVVEKDINKKRLFNLEPANILNSVSVNTNNEVVFTDLNGISETDHLNNTSEILNNNLASPIKHLDILFTGLGEAMEHGLYDREDNILENTMDSFDNLLTTSNLSLKNDTFEFVNSVGLSTTTRYPLSEIVNTYNPKIQPIVTKNNMVDIIPQKMITPTNVFSSLITSCIPSFMSRVGLSAVSFGYNSFHGAYKIYNIEAFDLQDQNLIIQKWTNFFRIFKFELEQIIRASVGEFDLTINSSINGSTYVHLNLMDFELLPDEVVYEENNLLGGLTSSEIGTSDCAMKNAFQLSGILKNLSGTLDGMGVYPIEPFVSSNDFDVTF